MLSRRVQLIYRFADNPACGVIFAHACHRLKRAVANGSFKKERAAIMCQYASRALARIPRHQRRAPDLFLFQRDLQYCRETIADDWQQTA